MRPIIPLSQLSRRLPEAGRIRTGVKVAGEKNGKKFDRPNAIDTFRFTSSDQEAIGQVAAIYGGTPRPWKGSPTPGQWEVITEAAEIAVVLPPDPLGGTPLYEAWTGGGCSRRCDGVTCSIVQQGVDGPELEEVDCLCSAKGERLCTPHTRLSVILPDVRFAGTWRYESAKSWQVAQELPGMVDLIQSLQDRGLTRALLAIEHRKSVTAGETHRYTIPVLRVADTLDALASGAARVNGLGAGSTAPALGAGSSEGDAVETEPAGSDGAVGNGSGHPSDDEDIVDAEVVDDRTLADVLPAGTTPAQALLAARKVAERQGIELPSKLDEVTDYRFIAAVLDELGLVPG